VCKCVGVCGYVCLCVGVGLCVYMSDRKRRICIYVHIEWVSAYVYEYISICIYAYIEWVSVCVYEYITCVQVCVCMCVGVSGYVC